MGIYDFAIYRLVDVLFEDVIDVLARGTSGDPKCSPLPACIMAKLFFKSC